MKHLKDIKQKNDGVEAKVFFNLFEQDIDVYVEDTNSIEYAEKCAKYLNEINNGIITHLCNSSIKYCNLFLETVGNIQKDFSHHKEVLKLIQPIVLIVPGLTQNEKPVIHLELNCEWEIEHGLEWIIRGDKVLYVGAFNGEDPMREFSEKDDWNFA